LPDVKAIVKRDPPVRVAITPCRAPACSNLRQNRG
jgi:hypothetical protein